ncbi:MAG: lipid-A-disaccharide synthase [Prevotella sp.]|nr:lipid-A-disaccharide synthase [Prevotella sp.]
MKYYLIAGEASGDLHAARLMQELKLQDGEAEFRCYGGDQMKAAGGQLVKHYRELAYMGFVPVLLHLPTILRNMKHAKKDIAAWKPDVVILVDYPGFNLSIAKYVHKKGIAPVYYYISPKIWAWKEYRIKNIKRDVDELFSILPFEVDFFEKKHQYPIHYVGNPTNEEVSSFRNHRHEPIPIDSDKPIVALLCGSRRQEIKDNLPAMVTAARRFVDYQFVVAGAPAIEEEYYHEFLHDSPVTLVMNQTYELLSTAHAALVTSGTATLETALFGVPQVVCYETPLPRLIGWLRKKILKVKYISLVNLIADGEVVRELVADSFTQENIERELAAILPAESTARQEMLRGYEEVQHRLGTACAPRNAAQTMIKLLKNI